MFVRIFGATPFRTSPVSLFSNGKGSDGLWVLINPRAWGKLCKGKTGLCGTIAALVPPGKVGTNGSLGDVSGSVTTFSAVDALFNVLRFLPSAKKDKVHYNIIWFASIYISPIIFHPWTFCLIIILSFDYSNTDVIKTNY